MHGRPTARISYATTTKIGKRCGSAKPATEPKIKIRFVSKEPVAVKLTSASAFQTGSRGTFQIQKPLNSSNYP